MLFSPAKAPDEQYEYLRELLSDHSVLELEEKNDLLAGLLVHRLIQDPQRRVSLGRLLEHNFFKFAGCPLKDKDNSLREEDAAVEDAK